MVSLAAGCGLRQVRQPALSAAQRPPATSVPAPLSTPGAGAGVLWNEPFDLLDPTRWRQVEIKGRTQYDIIEIDGEHCLRATSQASASILLTEVQFDPKAYPWLSWRWRVDELVKGESLEHKRGSDCAARVYVYFDTRGLPWQKRSLDYVWSGLLPVGQVLSSAFSDQSKIVVVESGSGALGQWRQGARNIAADYRQAFGGDVPRVLAVGVMTDTDNTGSSALAYVDDITISGRRPNARGAR